MDTHEVTQARILPSPGALVDLTRVAPPAQALVGLVRSLWPVLRPLAVDLVTADANWHLRAGDAPEWVTVRPTLGLEPREREVPELTPEVFAQFLATPGEFETLGVYYTRARLFGREELELWDGDWTIAVRVERRPDGVWVAGPLEDGLVPAPVGFTVYEQWRQLHLRVSVNWSPWSEPGQAEHAELVAALRGLLDDGWQRTRLDDLGL